MELLAPAGSLSQAIASIKGGCDALYGGLKKWSARCRAANFTVEEYCELINMCKHRSIRFYLTLNTLVTDSELNAIIDLFSNSHIPKPDAFIVGDIGLCDTLTKIFPETPIHASTQFGAYTLRDALFFQSLGVKRIILARELTLEEVCYIKKHAVIEVEVFVYGNQCIVFSGNCLWGGLTKTGSGHKGGCIGSCNDFYQTRDGAIGNFFWSNNIGLFSFASCLESKGIDCIKIEGRLRKSNEIINIVSKFRSALDGESIDNDYDFDGYLAGKLPPHNQLHFLNPQNTFRIFESIAYTGNDVVVKEIQEENRLSLGDGTGSGKYVCTIFGKSLKRNETNIQLRFKFVFIDHTFEIETIECLQEDGTRISYGSFSRNSIIQTLTFKDLYKIVERGVKVNIYECKGTIPSLSLVNVDIARLKQVIEEINSIMGMPQQAHQTVPVVSVDDIILLDNYNDLKMYYSNGFHSFFYRIRTKEDLIKCLGFNNSHFDCHLFYMLPYLDFTNQIDSICQLLIGKNIIISRPSQLILTQKYKFNKVLGDYTLNIWNTKSAEWFKQHNLTVFIAHPELSLSQIEIIEDTIGIEFLLIGSSQLPFGYTRACFSELGICGKSCHNQSTSLLNLNKGYNVELICDNEFGYRTITDNCIYVSVDQSSNHRKVIGVIGLTESEKKEILHSKKILSTNTSVIYI